MNGDYECFIDTIESANTKKVVSSLRVLGEHDYTDCSYEKLEQIILHTNPNSPKAIITACYVLGLYARYMKDNELYSMVQELNKISLWEKAKPNAKRKFISHSAYTKVCEDVDIYEDFNGFYQQTLIRSVYEGIYNDDMSVLRNLKASDINGNKVVLREDNGHTYELKISESLADDLRELGYLDIWERKNRYGICSIKTSGLYPDSCFKVENRKGSMEYSYRFTYYRIIRKIAKEYLEYNLLPLQLYVSGIMYRINQNLKEYDIKLEDAFSNQNRDKMVSKIISDELTRCNCNTEVRNFREMVKGHLDVFIE
jgi:hypothetical protein